MGGKSAFIYHPVFEDRGLSPFPSVWQRYMLTKELLIELGVLGSQATSLIPEMASLQELERVHSGEYIEFVRQKSLEGKGFLDGGDTPAYSGVYERARASAGGSVEGALLLGGGEYLHAFNPGGGLHHARWDRAGGFCVFNDVALAVRTFQERFGYTRIAVVDIDGHHADGTQDYFYSSKVLTLSLHRFDPLFYPGTGELDELGEGEGKGFSVNVPLPARTSGDIYLHAFHTLVPPLLTWYRPQVIILQCGVDGHYRDPLVRLYLTTWTYQEIASSLHHLSHDLSAGKLLLLGGGGYNPENVARCWAIIFATVAGGVSTDLESKFIALHDREIKNPSQSDEKEVKETVFTLKGRLEAIHGKIF